MGKYDDIIHTPWPRPTKRARMSLEDRAAQFAPFAALTGHEAAIQETARLTDRRIELDEHLEEELSIRLRILIDHIQEAPQVAVTYFQADAKKSGGRYQTIFGKVQKINEYDRVIILNRREEGEEIENLNDSIEIPLDEIIRIEGRVLEQLCQR